MMDLSRVTFYVSLYSVLIIGSFGYGAFAYRGDLFPIPELRVMVNMVGEVVMPSERAIDTDPVSPNDNEPVQRLNQSDEQAGLIAIMMSIAPRQTVVRVIDRDGNTVHEWFPVWKEIWPDDEGDFPARPVNSTHLHGFTILPDGSLVANFSHQSTFRMDLCGEVLWKLDNLGHHSVNFASDNTIWAQSEIPISEDPTGYDAHSAPLKVWTIQNIDMNGSVISNINIHDVIIQNDLEGLLYMASIANGGPLVSGDTLHANDVEAFPSSASSDLFKEGDLLVSLRNINTVLVFDPTTLEVKWLHTGGFVRQHDPDFLPNGNISVFDNRNFLVHSETHPYSRIVEIDPVSGDHWVVLGSESDRQFFTEVTGSHQRLANGNILVVPSQEGRVLEFSAEGEIVWRFDNRLPDGTNGRTYNVEVLPSQMNRDFFKNATENCNS